jgi:hypothetical protein
MHRRSNYDKFPSIRVPVGRESVWQGWREIVPRIAAEISLGAQKISVETYPGVFEEQVLEALVEGLRPERVFRTKDCWKSSAQIEEMVGRDLTDDPVFGRISQLTINDFADPKRTAKMRAACRSAKGVTLILGTGTALVAPDPDVLILADLARWEIQRRPTRQADRKLSCRRCSRISCGKIQAGVLRRLARGRPHQTSSS